jgi:hypothetical protein
LVSRGCPAKTIGSVLTDTPPGGDPTKKQHLVPFKEEYRQLKMFRAMQYDGTTLHYAPQKSPIEKTIGDKVRHRGLPGKEK